MIYGIGIDSVEITRFTAWHHYPDKRLLRLMSMQEIAYCKAVSGKKAERFAVRFSAREALFKALQAAGYSSLPFLSLCKATTITHSQQGVPRAHINWSQLARYIALVDSKQLQIHLSVTHTKTTATAVVFISRL